MDLVVNSGDIDRAGELASACVEAGGQEVRLQSVAFSHRDPREFYVRAREAAFVDASARAAQLSTLAGRELGVVEEISEGEYSAAGGLRYDAMEAPPLGLSIGPGTLSVSSSVTVRWSWT